MNPPKKMAQLIEDGLFKDRDLNCAETVLYAANETYPKFLTAASKTAQNRLFWPNSARFFA